MSPSLYLNRRYLAYTAAANSRTASNSHHGHPDGHPPDASSRTLVKDSECDMLSLFAETCDAVDETAALDAFPLRLDALLTFMV